MNRVITFLCFCVFLTKVCSQNCFKIQFLCGDGKCLSRSNDDNGVCDGRRDCSDGSDENRCGLASGCRFGEYQCLNGQCISGSSVCDGQNDCGDNSDEIQCGTSDLVGFIVGLTLGIIAFVFCCTFGIIFGVIGCVCCAVRHQQKIDRELRSKNVSVSSGGLFGSSVTTSATASPSNVVYTKQEEKVDV